MDLTKGKHIASSAKHASHAFQSQDVAFAGVHAGAHAGHADAYAGSHVSASGSLASSRASISIPRNVSILFKLFAVLVVTVAIAIIIGLGFASAGNNGITQSNSADQAATQASAQSSTDVVTNEEASVLLSSAHRDMSTPVAETQAQEEAIRIAAEEKARAEEQAALEKVAQAKSRSAASGGVGVYDVDFSVGKDAFISEWTTRINKYLAGSPLAGYGAAFAEAAWKYGVDPRWSPAISNTESTKGSNCFAWHNAWGWTGGSWSNWGTAIDAHVSGLASVYGYTISYSNAQKYCPPNYNNWYNDTLNEMRKI